MRLHVRHETTYAYAAPLAYSVQRLYLTPQDSDTQRTLNWRIDAPGIDGALTYVDGFGNRVHLITFRQPDGPVSVVAEGVVEVQDSAGIQRRLRCPAPDAVFLRQTDATRPDGAIAAMAEAARAGASGPVDVLHRLMAAIDAHMTYTLGATHHATTAAEAFASGHGVCQDHAHVFVGACRHLGIPARYVTGYLALDSGGSATASHAWGEARVADLGWVGFDCANGHCPDGRYIRVAGGIDAAGITPIRGSRRGGAGEVMAVTVDVRVEQ